MNKHCPMCKATKSSSHFYKDARSNDGLLRECISCNKRIQKERRDRINAGIRIQSPHTFLDNKDTIENRRAYVLNLKQETPCASCGKFDSPNCMDYHHTNPQDKSFTIGAIRQLGNTIDLNDVKDEINKCILLCVCCHKKLHSGDICLLT